MAASAALKNPTFFIVDGSNNVYRSYFAIRGLTNSSGLATNAVYGFTTMLRKMLKDHEPDLVAVAFDIGRAATRHEAFADYKKDRRPMPDDLAIQLPYVNEVLDGFGIPVIGVTDWRAGADQVRPRDRRRLREIQAPRPRPRQAPRRLLAPRVRVADAGVFARGAAGRAGVSHRHKRGGRSRLSQWRTGTLACPCDRPR